jgi:carbon starvation protein
MPREQAVDSAMLALIALGVMALLCVGYFAYGSLVARQYSLDDARVTPAVQKADGVDFVPAKPFYLLGQHFSAIAAAGPIVGPIAACTVFGWGPSLLWIVLGVILIGAVHDFSALVASVRHGASSIAHVAKEHLGKRAWLVLTAFIYVALLYVIIAFTDVTAQTFQGLTDELLARPETINKGGSVALASVLYLSLALLMGVIQRFTKLPGWIYTVVFVPATLGCVYLGSQLPNVLNIADIRVWYGVILAYCFVASLLPVWLLQQPRGYLGGWMLYLACAVGLLGILFGGFEIKRDAFEPVGSYAKFFAGGEGAPPLTALVFPFLFVTIACGACSGFHGLICGGTTSKQISKESHCKAIGFGAMLLEGLVAVVALSTIMIVAKSEAAGRTPGVIYGDGLAMYITSFFDRASVRDGTWMSSPVFVVAATFGAMAFSTFVFDTLDVSARLGRYLLTELTGVTSRWMGYAVSLVTVLIPLVLLLGPASAKTGQGSVPAWQLFWTLFGSSNQLLAALTLLGITVWLVRTGKRCWYVAGPMAFVLVVTVTALGLQLFAGVREVGRNGFAWSPVIVNATAASLLLGLAGIFVVEAWRSIRHRPAGAA